MKFQIKHIYHLFALTAVLGLFGSLMHYHSEGLECLNHAEEQHYVQNDNTCPICTLVVEADHNADLDFEGFLAPEGILVISFTEAPSVDLFLSEPGRAPPFMV